MGQTRNFKAKKRRKGPTFDHFNIIRYEFDAILHFQARMPRIFQNNAPRSCDNHVIITINRKKQTIYTLLRYFWFDVLAIDCKVCETDIRRQRLNILMHDDV